MEIALFYAATQILQPNVMKIVTKIYTITSIALLGSASAWAQSTTPPTTPGAGHGEWRAKWAQMTPQQKETFLQNHPKIAQWIAQHQQEMADDSSGGSTSTGSTGAGSTGTGSTGSGGTTAGGTTTGGTTTGGTTTGGTTTGGMTAGAANGAWKQKWQQMTADQKESFLQNHPKFAQQFSQNHPQAAQRLATTQEAGAGITDPGHPRVNEVNGRETNQQNRIAQGVSSGTITPQEQAQLQRSGNRIQKQEGNDLARHDGHLTTGEKVRLNREENRRSRQINKDVHPSS
jgi:2-oxo-4-hydroxy-4-carboxy--5-ureidoimidazoline (OHCU) decarboxylase